jgi:DNA-binding MarR family transcriptional regulator/predicted GIY-YIG superfamily endonuclease
MTESNCITYVYFIIAGTGPIKIGVASDPETRLNALQTAHYKRLRLLSTIECATREAAFKLENALHCMYKDHNLMNEWFDIAPGEITTVVAVLLEVAQHVIKLNQITSLQEIEKLESKRENRKRDSQTHQGERVRSYLSQNPNASNFSVRELSRLLGVSKSTVSNVRSGMSKNGHGVKENEDNEHV